MTTKKTNQKSNSVAKTRQEFLVEKLTEQLTTSSLIERSSFNGMSIHFSRTPIGIIYVVISLCEQFDNPGPVVVGAVRQLVDAIKLGFTVHEPKLTKGSTDQNG